MRSYTVHLRAGDAPALVPEAFSWGAAILGPFWLFGRGAVLAGLGGLGLAFLAALLPGAFGGICLLALAWAFGLFGQDLRRWGLARRGYTMSGVIRAANAEAALVRLLAERPGLMTEALT